MLVEDGSQPARGPALPGWTSLKARLAECLSAGDRFAVLVLDIDRLRALNDSLGRSTGDQLILAVAERLWSVVGDDDVLVHLGGDEFAMLLSDCPDARQAAAVTRTILDAFRAPFAVDGREVYATLSVGIAVGSADYGTPEECVRDADLAMYRAKRTGRARHVVFSPDLRSRLDALDTLETDLRRAVARREFEVHYQPIVSLADGSIEGFEALVRWQHPDRGLLYPDAFIPIAEQTGLVVPIGWLVLDEACRQLSTWRSASHREPFVSVNFSGQQFLQPDVVERVASALDETGCNAGDLRLELTETTLMEHPRGIHELQRLTDLDIQLYLDDFGTGYSSLGYLHRLPTHAIKIDRSFVSQVVHRSEIVGTILALAKTLGLRVEAEGIETAGQLRRLQELGCEFGQGFFFSRPVSSGTAARLVDARLAR